MAQAVRKVGGALGQGPMVTSYDAGTQKVELVDQLFMAKQIAHSFVKFGHYFAKKVDGREKIP